MLAQKLSHARQNYQERTFYQWLKVSTVGFLALAVIYTLTSLLQLQGYLRLKAEQKGLIEDLALLTQTELQMRTLEPRIKQNEKLNKELSPTAALAQVLINLSQLLPEATYLSSLTYTSEAVFIEGFAPHKAEVEAFMERLANEPEYTEVTLTTSQEQMLGHFFRIRLNKSLQP